MSQSGKWNTHSSRSNTQSSEVNDSASSGGSSNISPLQSSLPIQNVNYKTIQHFKHLHKYALSYYHSLNDYMYTPLATHYFKKAFTLFQDLWSLQQKHRLILQKPPLNLKREDIGMIALRIAQLYYQNYIRTSNAKYLEEAFQFFNAIDERNYFKEMINFDKDEFNLNLGEDTLSNIYIDKPKKLTDEYLGNVTNQTHKYDDLVSENIMESYSEYKIEKLDEPIRQDSPNHKDELSYNDGIRKIHKAYNTVLRYYARFIMTCLFLNRKNHIYNVLLPKMKELLSKYEKDLQKRAIDIFREDELIQVDPHLFHSSQWRIVILELITFLKCDTFVVIEDYDWLSFRQIKERHFSETISSDSFEDKCRIISNACLISNTYQNIKFSELSISLYRMMLFLEIKPPTEMKSPEKIFLSRPTFSQAFDAFNTCFKKNKFNQGMLLYLQVDGTKNGLILEETDSNDEFNNSNVITFSDILPFTRKPLFLIVDSDMNLQWDITMKKSYSAPFVCFINRKPLSNPMEFSEIKEDYIKDTTESQIEENLITKMKKDYFSFFLCHPIVAYLAYKNIKLPSESQFDSMEKCLRETLDQIHKQLSSIPDLPSDYVAFFDDPFTRAFIFRYLLYYFILKENQRDHLNEIQCETLPEAYPQFPDSILSQDSIVAFTYSNLFNSWNSIIQN